MILIVSVANFDLIDGQTSCQNGQKQYLQLGYKDKVQDKIKVWPFQKIAMLARPDVV